MVSRLNHKSSSGAPGSENGMNVVGPGDRLAGHAMVVLLGIVVAAAALVFWQLYMQTSDLYNEPERIYGWGALGRDLPAFALLLVPIAIGMSLSARAIQFGSRRGRLVAGLNTVVLFGVGFWVLDAAVHELVRSAPDWVAWPLLVVAAAIAGVAFVVASRSARGNRRAEPTPRGPRPAWRHRRSLALALTGLVASLAWLAIAQATLTASTAGFVRANLPGTVILDVNTPGTYFVYAEKSAAVAPEGLAVEVVSDGGASLAVSNFVGGPAYLRELRGARPVASFSAPVPGIYRVSASVSPLYPRGTFAVGPSVAGWMTPSIRGADLVLLAAVGLAAWVDARDGRKDRRYAATGTGT